jgi:D-amino-acid dehydrogenase
MHVIVLGAGVIGTTSAWFLRNAGHQVTVVERQRQAASETSFANGGQVSVSHAKPWANPAAPLQVLRWLGRDDAPLLFRPRLDAAQWRWCLNFLLECLPHRTHANMAKIVELGLYSRRILRQLRSELELHYDDLQCGILHFYTSRHEYDAATKAARVMRDLGCDLEALDREQVIAIEPALRFSKARIIGGTMSYQDESGDACAFTRQLADSAAAGGVAFQFGTTVMGLDAERDKISSVCVRTPDGSYDKLTADAFVIAMGSYSAGWLKPLGVNLLVYPAKGYSATLPVHDRDRAYSVSLTDDEYKLVFSRLGDRLRIAGTAELSGYDLSLNTKRCDSLLRRTLEIFPNIAKPEEAQFWTGLRPATPSNVPYIGKTKYQNLFVNTGHGTLGWTHSCGSAQILADIVSNRRPEVSLHASDS